MSFNTRTAISLFKQRAIVGSRSIVGDLVLRAIWFRWGSNIGQEICSSNEKLFLLTPSTPQLEGDLKVWYIMVTPASIADTLLRIGQPL